MESDPTTEIWYAVAEVIGGRTVAELQQVMSHEEFVGWQIFLARKAQRHELAEGQGKGVS
jgi:hypothetical protein